MTTKTQGPRRGDFIQSEANGTRSRDTGTVASGQNLQAGEVVMLSAGKLVAHDGDLDSAGDVSTPVAGVMFDNVDASATGANADVPGAVIIARDAEVSDADLIFPDESSAGGEKAAVTASLKSLGIIPR